MPASDWNISGGLYVPDDAKAKARKRIVETLKLTHNLLCEAAAPTELYDSLAPEVFRLVYHEGLLE